uniref:Putative secreted protein n=1 Tax=Anopheles darlingi TaxID=43151 RepID=A0A2M4DHA0_ANODA
MSSWLVIYFSSFLCENCFGGRLLPGGRLEGGGRDGFLNRFGQPFPFGSPAFLRGRVEVLLVWGLKENGNHRPLWDVIETGENAAHIMLAPVVPMFLDTQCRPYVGGMKSMNRSVYVDLRSRPSSKVAEVFNFTFNSATIRVRVRVNIWRHVRSWRNRM